MYAASESAAQSRNWYGSWKYVARHSDFPRDLHRRTKTAKPRDLRERSRGVLRARGDN